MKVLLIILGALYLLSPYDILPDFLVGWGWLDDGAVLYMLWRYLIAPAIRRKQQEKFYQQNRQYQQGQQSAGNHRSGGAHSSTDAGRTGTYEDPYRVLGVPRSASPEEIKQAFKQLANKYHPDKVHHLGTEFKELAEKRFKEIQEAYQALGSK